MRYLWWAEENLFFIAVIAAAIAAWLIVGVTLVAILLAVSGWPEGWLSWTTLVLVGMVAPIHLLGAIISVSLTWTVVSQCEIRIVFEEHWRNSLAIFVWDTWPLIPILGKWLASEAKENNWIILADFLLAWRYPFMIMIPAVFLAVILVIHLLRR